MRSSVRRRPAGRAPSAARRGAAAALSCLPLLCCAAVDDGGEGGRRRGMTVAVEGKDVRSHLAEAASVGHSLKIRK